MAAKKTNHSVVLVTRDANGRVFTNGTQPHYTRQNLVPGRKGIQRIAVYGGVSVESNDPLAVYEFKQGDKTGEAEAIRRAKEDWAPVGL